ncbi:MAG: putative NEK protein kinase [Streblomastix strix]|uniref:Putative NEK protein kinase n=1 Tax=Streblomastix strix TaxID=222440 RepID=A0A5J4THP0_9EUKA|nr:MAG: putative NEK protein kinase [Streblomastix strix]
MEYCEKGDLRKVISDLQKLPEEERLMRVWELLAQIAFALDHLHSLGIVHRDIKPENIFVMADGSVRLGDFGLAKDIQNAIYATVVGTKVYQAVEVFIQKRMTQESDVFAVGIVIFYCLSGKHPFDAESVEEMIEKIKKGEMNEIPQFVSIEMKELILSMLNQV